MMEPAEGSTWLVYQTTQQLPHLVILCTNQSDYTKNGKVILLPKMCGHQGGQTS